MDSIVLKLLEENTVGLNLKKLKKKAVEVAGEHEDFSGKDKKETKDAFETSLTSLLEKKKIAEEEGVYTKCAKKQSKSKRKVSDLADDEPSSTDGKVESVRKEKPEKEGLPPNYDNNDEDEPMKMKRGRLDVSSLTNLSCKIDLSREGERAWRENLLDDEYLRTNPDGITRIFCGNLNKKVTEEEMKSCLEGIVYIKWITDKQTREFYGSTFLEMKDPKAAAMAVMKDKSKFMGR
jgi:hypothetical protein